MSNLNHSIHHWQKNQHSAGRASHIAVIGGGPAGLRAAEVAAENGARVTLYDAQRSVGRKFLVAGKSGLNLTFDEGLDLFLEKYTGAELPQAFWREIISGFDNVALRQWAAGLGVETMVASSGKVFPVPSQGRLSAAPLLRRWITRLRSLGVVFKTQHRWLGFDDETNPVFEAGEGTAMTQHSATILALGGASWPQTGSDGRWVDVLTKNGVALTPLTSSNCGWEADWSEVLRDEAEGLPLKNILLKAGDSSLRGELVITRYGLEGAPIYRLGPEIRKMGEPHVNIDFKPDSSHEELVQRMGNVRRNFIREARRRLKLDPAACSLLKYLPDRGPWRSPDQLVGEIKNCQIPLTRPRPIEEAISSAGGICWKEIDKNLMLKKIPNVFVAGEMIDWDAPTGGYLLQACFATGTYAGKAASKQI